MNPQTGGLLLKLSDVVAAHLEEWAIFLKVRVSLLVDLATDLPYILLYESFGFQLSPGNPLVPNVLFGYVFNVNRHRP